MRRRRNKWPTIRQASFLLPAEASRRLFQENEEEKCSRTKHSSTLALLVGVAVQVKLPFFESFSLSLDEELMKRYCRTENQELSIKNQESYLKSATFTFTFAWASVSVEARLLLVWEWTKVLYLIWIHSNDPQAKVHPTSPHPFPHTISLSLSPFMLIQLVSHWIADSNHSHHYHDSLQRLARLARRNNVIGRLKLASHLGVSAIAMTETSAGSS